MKSGHTSKSCAAASSYSLRTTWVAWFRTELWITSCPWSRSSEMKHLKKSLRALFSVTRRRSSLTKYVTMSNLKWIRLSKGKLTTRNAPRIGKSGNGRSKSRPTTTTANEKSRMKVKLRLQPASDHNPKENSQRKQRLKGSRVQMDCQSKFSRTTDHLSNNNLKMITVPRVSPHCRKLGRRRNL